MTLCREVCPIANIEKRQVESGAYPGILSGQSWELISIDVGNLSIKTLENDEYPNTTKVLVPEDAEPSCDILQEINKMKRGRRDAVKGMSQICKHCPSHQVWMSISVNNELSEIK